MSDDDFNIDDLKEALRKIAELVMIDRVYLPIFERLENEIAARKRDEDLFERAKAVVNG
mgnify:FL=1